MLSKFTQIIFISSFLAACGAAPNAEDGQPTSNGSSSKTVISAASSTPTSTPMSSSSKSMSSTSKSMSSTSKSMSSTSKSMSSTSKSMSSSKASSTPVMQSSSSSVISSSATSSKSSSSSVATKQVTIQWSHPTEREDGSYLTLDEIAGYEIRTKTASASFYTRYPVEGNNTTSYVLNSYVTGMIVEIAVYDSNGVYSQFARVSGN